MFFWGRPSPSQAWGRVLWQITGVYRPRAGKNRSHRAVRLLFREVTWTDSTPAHERSSDPAIRCLGIIGVPPNCVCTRCPGKDGVYPRPAAPAYRSETHIILSRRTIPAEAATVLATRAARASEVAASLPLRAGDGCYGGVEQERARLADVLRILSLTLQCSAAWDIGRYRNRCRTIQSCRRILRTLRQYDSRRRPHPATGSHTTSRRRHEHPPR